MAIIGKINDEILIDDAVLRKPETLTRWVDPTIEEKDKEIERLTAESTEWESKYYELQKENEKLKDEIYSTNQVVNELLDIKSRNEKAIEYIIKNSEMYDEDLCTDVNFELVDLLNILGGDE